ncbi:phosphate ABC transporter substrate-binding protein [soil metagenome]
MNLRTLILSFGLAVVAAICPAQEKSKIAISGSDTMNALTQRLAEDYGNAHPNVEIAVRGGGSGTGIADLMNGLNDIAQASRKMKPEEIEQAKKNGLAPTEIVVALDGIAIAVHKDSPVKELSLGQLKAIYVGAVKRWNELDPAFPDQPIVLFSRESNCGTYDFFKEHVLLKADFASNTSYLAATAAVANAVGNDKSAIGFGGVAYFVHAENVRVLAIKKDKAAPAICPVDVEKKMVNLAVIQDGTYAISRPLQYYTPHPPAGAVKEFLDWVLTAEGQAVVLKEDYIPLAAPTK